MTIEMQIESRTVRPARPFRIAGYASDGFNIVTVILLDSVVVGREEASGSVLPRR